MLFAAIADLVLINIFNRCQDLHHKEIEFLDLESLEDEGHSVSL